MIRPYEDDDLDDVLDAWYEASLIAHPFLTAELLDTERTRIAEEWLPASETIVYVTQGRVAGFLSLVGNEVGGIFVHPDQQRQGVGRTLMDTARDMRPYLELSVFEANLAARRFYEAYGFRHVDRHDNDTAGQPELRLRLDAPG